MNAQLLSRAVSSLLGQGETGDLAFTRALSHADIVQALAAGLSNVSEWQVVAVGSKAGGGWITADQAVELRESKGRPTFLLIDAHGAGAGMDGIYSAAREIDEKTLFKQAISLLLRDTERPWREFADEVTKRARRLGGRRNSTSLRQEVEFFDRVGQSPREAGRQLHLLGLWPVVGDTALQVRSLLAVSALMVEKLLMPPATSEAPTMRVNRLVLTEPSDGQIRALERILREAGSQPRAAVLKTVADTPMLWLGTLRPAFLDSALAKIAIVPWRRPNNSLWAWSGLRTIPGEDLPHLIIDPESQNTRLAIRWKTEPGILPRGSVNYEVRVVAGSEVLATRQIQHSGHSEQKVIFTHEDFDDLDPASKLETFVEVSAAGQTTAPSQQTEEIIITFGEAPTSQRVSSGEILRCLADGLVQCTSRDEVESFLEKRNKGEQATADKHGFVTCRLPGVRRGFRIERPRLLQEVETSWANHPDVSVARWVIRCRADGLWTSPLEFRPIGAGSDPDEGLTRLHDVSRRLRDNALKAAGALSRFYLHGHSSAALTAEYLNA